MGRALFLRNDEFVCSENQAASIIELFCIEEFDLKNKIEIEECLELFGNQCK